MGKRRFFLLSCALSILHLFPQETYTLEDGLNRKLYVKLYPLYSVMNRHSLSVEYFYKKGRSVEFQPVVLLKNEGLHGEFQKNISNVIFLRQGVEFFIGLNHVKLKAKKSITNGVYFSYKYVHINNGNYSYFPDPGYDPLAHYSYRFSQTRNQVNCHYRRSSLKATKRFFVEFYYMAGLCIGYSRNTVFYLSGMGNSTSYPMTQMTMKGLSLVNGSYVYPEIKIGFCPRLLIN